MRLILLSLAGAAVLTACSPAAQDSAAAQAGLEPPAGSTAQAPVIPPAQAPSAVSPPQSGGAPADACGAVERQGWVGQPRSAVPATPAGANWRIFETGQPVTEDLRPDRLNVEIDPATKRVVAVRCG